MHFSRVFLLFFLLILGFSARSQNVLFNADGGTPDASALMELRSTNQGLLVPRMLEAQRLAILSPAEGLLVYQRNSLVGFYYYNGTAWDTIGGSTTVNNISNVTNSSNSNIAVLQDLKGAFHGGTFSSGAWRERTINTHLGDSSFLTLGTDTFTLNQGIYILNATAPAYKVGEHQIRLYNCTTTNVDAVGSVASSAGSVTSSLMTTIINVTSATNDFIIEHRCASTQNTNGLGIGVAWSSNVYTQIWIQKL